MTRTWLDVERAKPWWKRKYLYLPRPIVGLTVILIAAVWFWLVASGRFWTAMALQGAYVLGLIRATDELPDKETQ